MCRQVSTIITTLVVVGLIVQVTYGQESREGEELVLSIKDDQKTQYINQNFETNVYNYGYEINPDGQFHHEVHGSDGVTYGCYGYVDPFGMPTATFYISDGWGYRVVHPRQAVEIFLHKHEHHQSDLPLHDHDHHEHHGIITLWENLQFPKECGNFENISAHPMRPHPSKPRPTESTTSTGSSGATPIQYPISPEQLGTGTSSGHLPNYPGQSQPEGSHQIHPGSPTLGLGPASIPESSSVHTSRPIPIEGGKPTKPDGISPQSTYPSYNSISDKPEYLSQVNTSAQSAHPSPTQSVYPSQTGANVPTQPEYLSQTESATQQGHPTHGGTPAQSVYPSQTGVQLAASPDKAPAQPPYSNQPGSGVSSTTAANLEQITPQPAYPSAFEPVVSPKPETFTQLPSTLEHPSGPEDPLHTYPKPEHSKPLKPLKPHKPSHSHAKPGRPHNPKPEIPPQQPSQPNYPSTLKPTVPEAPTTPYLGYPSSSSANETPTPLVQPEYTNRPAQPVNPNQEQPLQPGKPFHSPSKPGHSKPSRPEKPSRPHVHHVHQKPSRPEPPSYAKPHKPTPTDLPGSQTWLGPEQPSDLPLQPGYPAATQSGIPFYPSNQHSYPIPIMPTAPSSSQSSGYPTQSQSTGQTSSALGLSGYSDQSQPANPLSHPQTSSGYPDLSQLATTPPRPQASNVYPGQPRSSVLPFRPQTSNGYPIRSQPTIPPRPPQSLNGYLDQLQSGVSPSHSPTSNGYPSQVQSAAPPFPPQSSNGYPDQPQSGVSTPHPHSFNRYSTGPQPAISHSRPQTSNGYPEQRQPTVPTSHSQTSFGDLSQSKPADLLHPSVLSSYPSISLANSGSPYPQSQSGYPASLKPESPSSIDSQTSYLPASKPETSSQPVYVKPPLTNYPTQSKLNFESPSGGFSNTMGDSDGSNGNTGSAEDNGKNGSVGGTGPTKDLGAHDDNGPIGPAGPRSTVGPWPGDLSYKNENQPETNQPYSSGPNVPIDLESSTPTKPKYYQNAVLYSETIKNPEGTGYVYGDIRNVVQEHLNPAPFSLTENSPKRDDTRDNYRSYSGENHHDSYVELQRTMVSHVVSSENKQQDDRAKFIVETVNSQKNIEGEDMVRVDETIYQNREEPDLKNHEFLHQISKYDENYENVIPQDQRQLDTNLTPPRKYEQKDRIHNQRTEFGKTSQNHDEMRHINEKPALKFVPNGAQPSSFIKIKLLPLPVGPHPQICPCYIVESNNSTKQPPAPTTTTTTTTTTPRAIVESIMSEKPKHGILGFIPVIFVPHCPGDQTDSENPMKSIFPSATSIPYPCSVCNSQHTNSVISGQYVNLSQLGNIKAIKRLLSEANFGYLNAPVISAYNGRSRRQKIE